MGWKGTLRSISAASNRFAKEQQRQHNQLVRAHTKYTKKIQQIEDRREKIEQALKGEYASGKLTDERYASLSGRLIDITDELLVFGKTPGVALGKRYVCGKIDKEGFIKLRNELVPQQVYYEMETIANTIKQMQDRELQFINNCSDEIGKCQSCNRPKGFFRPIRLVENKMLCNSCKSTYTSLKQFPGFNGIYVAAAPCVISHGMILPVVIKQEYY